MIGVELELELEVDAARRRRVPGLAPSRHDRARVLLRRRENIDGRHGRGACAPRSGDGPARRSGRWVLEGHVIKAMAAPDFGRRRPARVAMSRRFRSAQAPSKSDSIVAKPPSAPQAPGALAAFFAPRQPRANPAVSSSASRIQGLQGAVATYAWGTIGAGILNATVQTDPKVALEKYYGPCPLAPLHSSRRGLVVEEVAKRFDTRSHPHVVVQAAEVTGQRKRSNTASDYLFGDQSTEVKGAMFQFFTAANCFKTGFSGIKKDHHDRCILVLVKDEFVEIFEFNSSVMPDPVPVGGSRKSFHGPRNQRNLISAVSQITRIMHEQCRFMGRVRYDDPHYTDLFEAYLGPIEADYAAFCPLHKVQTSRGVIIERVVADVLTDQLSDCTITHLGGTSSYDIKCEIKSKTFYRSFLESKFGEDVSAIVESYIEPTKIEAKSSIIHSYSNHGGTFNIAFTNIDRSKFDKLILGVCLPTSLELFQHDGASGEWTNTQKGGNLFFRAYGEDFNISRGSKNTGPRPNLLDLKTDWREVWTVIKKKMNKCKHIASIRF